MMTGTTMRRAERLLLVAAIVAIALMAGMSGRANSQTADASADFAVRSGVLTLAIRSPVDVSRFQIGINTTANYWLDSSAATLSGFMSGAANLKLVDTSGSEAEIYVRELYRQVLGKEPDSGGFKFWVDTYNQVKGDRNKITQEFVQSARRAGERILRESPPDIAATNHYRWFSLNAPKGTSGELKLPIKAPYSNVNIALVRLDLQDQNGNRISVSEKLPREAAEVVTLTSTTTSTSVVTVTTGVVGTPGLTTTITRTQTAPPTTSTVTQQQTRTVTQPQTVAVTATVTTTQVQTTTAITTITQQPTELTLTLGQVLIVVIGPIIIMLVLGIMLVRRRATPI